MKILKAFNKVLGYILCGVGIIFIVCFFAGVIVLSTYLTLMSWVEMPLEVEQTALDLPLEGKILVTICGAIMFFLFLGCVYLCIHDVTHPQYSSVIPPLPPSLRPKVSPKTENKPKKQPILG